MIRSRDPIAGRLPQLRSPTNPGSLRPVSVAIVGTDGAAQTPPGPSAGLVAHELVDDACWDAGVFQPGRVGVAEVVGTVQVDRIQHGSHSIGSGELRPARSPLWSTSTAARPAACSSRRAPRSWLVGWGGRSWPVERRAGRHAAAHPRAGPSARAVPWAVVGRPRGGRAVPATANPSPPWPAMSKTPSGSASSVTGPSSTRRGLPAGDRPPAPRSADRRVAELSTVVSVVRACYESRCGD
jgi:hypothetical protein